MSDTQLAQQILNATSLEQMRAAAASLSKVNNATGPTLSYSGPMMLNAGGFTRGEIPNWQFVESLKRDYAGQFRIIDDTEFGRTMSSINSDTLTAKVMELALAKNSGIPIVEQEAFAQDFIYGGTNSLWADGSGEFMKGAPPGSKIVPMTPNADPSRVWGATEIQKALASEAAEVAGVPRVALKSVFDTIAKTQGEAAAVDFFTSLSRVAAREALEGLAYTTKVGADGNQVLDKIDLSKFGGKSTNPLDFDSSAIQSIENPRLDHAMQAVADSVKISMDVANGELGEIYRKTPAAYAEIQTESAKINNALSSGNMSTVTKGLIAYSVYQTATEVLSDLAAGREAAAVQKANEFSLGMTTGIMAGELGTVLATAALAPLVAAGAIAAAPAALIAIGVGFAIGMYGDKAGRDAAQALRNPLNNAGTGIGDWLDGKLGISDWWARKLSGPNPNPVVDPTAAARAGGQVPRRDPLVLDLNGNGIELTPAATIVVFDHNGDGVKTGTAWIKPSDGWLVLDRNGNGTIDSGRELFGVDTIKASGTLALNGFDALSDFDLNTDGKIDANDAVFSKLRVWRDLNQDGVTQAGELSTLAEQGIVSIGVNPTPVRLDLGNGNIQSAAGTFVRADGTAGTAGETTSTAANLDLVVDAFHRGFTAPVPLTEDAKSLPDLRGAGMVRDLREAASLSPALATLMKDYMAETTRQGQLDQLGTRMAAWSDGGTLARNAEFGQAA